MKALRYITALVIFCGVIAGIFVYAPKQTQAQGVFVPTYDSLRHTTDIGNLTQNTISAQALFKLDLKENVFDGILVSIAKQVISTITQSIVNWINSGFEGGPAFVTNPEAFFTDLADQVTGQFIDRLGAGFLCQSFQIPLKLALSFDFNYGGQGSYQERYSCTLSSIVDNISSGNIVSLDTFFDVAVTTSNNPYGSYLAAQQQLSLNILGKQYNQGKLLDWGRGFLSKKECDENGENCTITTPGAIVEDQLANVMGSGIRQLELADEINEIIGALVNQMVKTVIETGVSGLSSQDSSGSRPIDRFVDETERFADETQDTLITGGPTRVCRGSIDLEGNCDGEEFTVNTDEAFGQEQDDTADETAIDSNIFSAILGNIARDGVASQSTQNTEIEGVVQGPQFALDGRTSGEHGRNDNFAIPSGSGNQHAWWEVNLGEEMYIEEIVIHRQTTEPQAGEVRDVSFEEALGNVDIIFFDGEGNERVGENIRIRPASGSNDEVITIETDITAQRIRLQKRTSGTIRLAEVIVQGRDVLSVTPTNLALNTSATARQSSVYRAGIPSQAINNEKLGNRGSGFSWPAVTLFERNPWWEVTLQQEAIIEKIVLHRPTNVSQSDSFRRIRVTIWSHNSTGTPVWDSGFFNVGSNSPRPLEIEVDGDFLGSARGRTVRIEREEIAGGTNRRLWLAEVEIIGRVFGN